MTVNNTGLTKEQVAQALPANLKSAATQALTDKINAITADPVVAEQIQENFISYTSVLSEGRFKTEQYLNAVAYVTHKLLGKSNHDAYAAAHPQRYSELLAKGTSSKDIAAYVSAYNKGKLVNLILEQTLIPAWVLNQHIYQKAINTQADLMQNANSEKVRSDAANSLLTHLTKPKEAVSPVTLNVNPGHSAMDELKDRLAEMAEMQRKLIESGVDTREIAGQKLIEGKVREV